MTLIIANIISGLSYLVLIICTFLNTKRKTILICFLISCVLYGSQSLMLGGVSGAYSQLFACLMYVFYYFKGKNKFLSSLIVPAIFIVGYITICVLTFNKWFDVMPLIASIISAISMWIGKEYYMKVLNIPISVMWISYSIIFMSYAGAVGQFIVLITDFVYLYLYYTKYRYDNEKNATQDE